MCLFVVKHRGSLVKYVHEQIYEICTAAVTQDELAFLYIQNITILFIYLRFNKIDLLDKISVELKN
jgi:hypothetical protein